MLRTLDEGDLAPEARHGLGHLHTHGPAAEHEQAARNGLHAGGLTVGPNAIELGQAWNRRNDRIGTAGNHDVLGRVSHAVDLDDPGAGQAADAAQKVDAVIGQPALLSGIGVLGDHEVAPGERRLHIDLRTRRGLPRCVDRLAWSQQRLGRDACPVGALTANQLALHHGHTQATLGKRAGACSPGEPAPSTMTS